MIPTKAVRLQLGELLADDATTLAPAANANELILLKDAFVPTEDLVIGDLTEADFDGYAPIGGAIGTQQAGVDPATGDQIVTNKEPLGGWRWEVTGATNLPQTIYGFALTDSTGATLLASELLAEPITLTAIGDEINVGVAQLRIVAQPIS